MNFMKIAAATAALALTTAPVIAQSMAQPVSVERQGAAIDEESDLKGSNVLIGVIALVAIVGAIIAVSSDGGPNSP